MLFRSGYSYIKAVSIFMSSPSLECQGGKAHLPCLSDWCPICLSAADYNNVLKLGPFEEWAVMKFTFLQKSFFDRKRRVRSSAKSFSEIPCPEAWIFGFLLFEIIQRGQNPHIQILSSLPLQKFVFPFREKHFHEIREFSAPRRISKLFPVRPPKSCF